MTTDLHFTKNDRQKFVEFLNYIHKFGSFNLKTPELIECFKLLQHMQASILPKIDANILEVVKVVEAEKELDEEQALKVEEPKKKS